MDSSEGTAKRGPDADARQSTPHTVERSEDHDDGPCSGVGRLVVLPNEVTPGRAFGMTTSILVGRPGQRCLQLSGGRACVQTVAHELGGAIRRRLPAGLPAFFALYQVLTLDLGPRT